MSQKKPKQSKGGESEPEKSTTTPSTIKEEFQRVQLALFIRSLQNIDFEFNTANKEDLIKLQADIMHLGLQRKLAAQDLGAFSHSIRNLIQLVAPPQGPQVNVTQQMAVDPEQAVAGFVNTLPSELRNAINAYVQQRVRELRAAPVSA